VAPAPGSVRRTSRRRSRDGHSWARAGDWRELREAASAWRLRSAVRCSLDFTCSASNRITTKCNAQCAGIPLLVRRDRALLAVPPSPILCKSNGSAVPNAAASGRLNRWLTDRASSRNQSVTSCRSRLLCRRYSAKEIHPPRAQSLSSGVPVASLRTQPDSEDAARGDAPVCSRAAALMRIRHVICRSLFFLEYSPSVRDN
jgi:hypothetical protein